MPDCGPPTLLFLCTGNYYRSRFAEYLFNDRAPARGLTWRALSRALRISPRNIGPLSVHAREELQRLGIEIEDPPRPPIPAREQDFSSSARIIAMKEAEHRAMIEAEFPDWVERVQYWHIDDLDCAEPHEALPRLQRHVDALLEQLAGETAN
ncbi:MAG: low molecular weight phosphatase family protein [Planctomycetales bacterium]|nr:low molecular weight phosphatase family protein [Planctomycetales bacterium]